MSDSKLRELHIELPLLPTTSVGSLPKPLYLTQGRTAFAQKKIGLDELEELERRATEFWVRRQDELGLDVLVDGEMYRGDMAAFFADHLSGFEQDGLVRSYGNRYYHKPIIVSQVEWNGPITVDWWRFAHGLTSKPVKGIVTGPYTMMDWSFNEFYSSRRDACLALAAEIHKEIEALIDAGCKIVQIDEPALSVRPEELELVIEAMEMTTRDLNAYFIVHICYGDFESIYPKMLNLAVDNFDLEISNSALDIKRLFSAMPFSKDISYGVVDVHTHLLEGEGVIEKRIKKGLEVLPQESLWIDPDCGLKTRTVEEAQAKLQKMVMAARALRDS